MLGVGGGAGWIVGNYVGGIIIVLVWSLVGCSLGIIIGI